MKRLIEICANSLDSALAAQRGGADRIELCSELCIGGVTPSYGLLSMVCEKLSSTHVNVLIRPRGGDFLYSKYEAEQVLRDILLCADLGVSGVVIGALDPYGNIDLPMCRKWVDIAHKSGLTVTFHRAIDRALDIFKATEDVISLGCERILSSGGKPSAIEGALVLQKMVSIASGRTIIMPGAGINPSNIQQLALTTGASEFHLSASRNIPSGMKVRSMLDTSSSRASAPSPASNHVGVGDGRTGAYAAAADGHIGETVADANSACSPSTASGNSDDTVSYSLTVSDEKIVREVVEIIHSF